MARYIFVLGGVMSGIGKGIATSSIAKIIQANGYNVTAIKIDPYVNVDAGTMNPTEHGEVFVLSNGLETDQDMGNYERFLDITLPPSNYMTTGSVYSKVITKERNLEYKGKCVQIIPHITDEVISTFKNVAKINKADFVITEIGGTVGDYENALFMEAARQLKLEKPKNVIFIMISYLPCPNKIGEMKTKPTQQAARAINTAGIQPDFIIARSEIPMDEKRKEKIALFCNVEKENVIGSPDIENIYEIPLNFKKEKLDQKILHKFGLKPKKQNLSDWKKLTNKIKKITQTIKIAMVGKYFATGDFTLSDSYISVIESIKYASWKNNVLPEMSWLDAEKYEKNPEKLKELKNYDGIVVPGGFGSRGTEGIIKAIQFARINKIPYLGLCYGMQLACVEFARNICGFKNANSSEINPKNPNPVINIMPEQEKLLEGKNYGGTMRLGSYPCKIKKGTLAFNAYHKQSITERHRHRYEFNNKYRQAFEKQGMIFSGISPNNKLVEIIELNKKIHPFFVGVQFHPEFQSRPTKPHPLFVKFIEKSIAKKTKK